MNTKPLMRGTCVRMARVGGLVVVSAVILLGCAMLKRTATGTRWNYPAEIGGIQSPSGTLAEGVADSRRAAGGYVALGRPVRGFGVSPALEESVAPAAPPEAIPGGGEPAEPSQPIDLAAAKRLVIYTARFGILVGNVEAAMKDLLAKIEAWDGYLEKADLQTVTFRVPAGRFDRAVEAISQMGVVTDKQIRAEDVTRQFRDLQLRLEVAETSRKRLLAILEKADKAEDILKIENEIRRLTEEIEGMKAELRTLADRIAYSTLTVAFTAKAPQVQKMSRRRASYFQWINRIGAEYVMRNF